jgi:hypothetical protein
LSEVFSYRDARNKEYDSGELSSNSWGQGAEAAEIKKAWKS